MSIADEMRRWQFYLLPIQLIIIIIAKTTEEPFYSIVSPSRSLFTLISLHLLLLLFFVVTVRSF